jgi:iron(II)-dependent oxidoreductase
MITRILLISLFVSVVFAGDEQLPGPSSHAAFPSWFGNITEWKKYTLDSIKYDSSIYNITKLLWTSSSFVQPQVMIHDRYLFNPITQQWTVDRYLDDLQSRYGGIDSVLLWHSYPNIGCDNRNQFDMLADLPGGLKSIRDVIDAFHKRNVKVLFPYNPWDQGTREEKLSDDITLNSIITVIGADGFNGDTMREISRDFFRDKSPIAIEPELGPTPTTLQWCKLGWGYFDYEYKPTLCRYKWLEPRHNTHLCKRWSRDHTDDLQHAFFNGIGFESWENVWGIWNQVNKRDSEALRRIATISRFFSDLLIQNWIPHIPTTIQNDFVFASRFGFSQRQLWTLVNRSDRNLTGAQLHVDYDSSRSYLDVYHGVKLEPKVKGGMAVLSFDIEAKAYGAILSISTSAIDEDLLRFLNQMREMTKNSLSSYSSANIYLPQKLVPIPPTSKPTTPPSSMAYIPRANQWKFISRGIEIEGGDDIGVDFQYEILNESLPRRSHAGSIDSSAFYIDIYPTTNALFKKFLNSGYKPRDPHNFLKDWSNGEYPKGWDNKPVTHVSLDDARAYCKWTGKRLPHEWEWQRAMQQDDRKYPWGNMYDATKVPVPDTGRDMRGPDDVNAHNFSTPFGVQDAIGNVWQWTDEYVDDHTRAAALKGGCYYSPQGSSWYFPQVGDKVDLTVHGKYLLMAESQDRSGCIGFRCVMDAN